ncbi:halo transducer protein [Haloferax sp. S1W]|uniref:halo transducer protein n=1 Tax=Haloferax sp. S1W TaxID=3377110 RepID=UPI0037C9D6DD
MGTEDSDAPARIVGLSKDEATEELVAEDETRDPQYVRAVLDHVTDGDGVITRDAVDDAVTDTSMILSTAETRVELATIALSEATEAARDVADVDAVRTRLDTFEQQVSAAEERVSELGSEMQSLSHWHSDSRPVYDLVTDLRGVASDAQTVQRVADDVQFELEEFEHWLSDDDLRRCDLGSDVDALERSLDDVARTREDLDTDTDAVEASGVDAEVAADAAETWYGAMLRCRVVPLLLADLRAELADLRELAARDDIDDTSGLDDIETRLDDIDAQADQHATELDALASQAWTDRYGELLADFRSALDEFEPPVSWGAVQKELDRFRDGPTN